jgi:ADP-ribose pyrophosphatase YjhB (NUDIX family)
MLGSIHHLALQVYRRLPVVARRRVVRTISPSYTVGAMVIIERADGAVLLARLSYRNSWGVPGGLLKRGESPADAALREVHEEIGMDVELLGDPAVVVDEEAQRVDVVFRGRPAAGADPELARPCSPEILEVGWFPADDLPDLQFETSGALMALARRAVTPERGQDGASR